MNSTFIKSIVALTGATAIMIALVLAGAGRAQEKTPPAPERIGVYDSRAVAVAYAGSAELSNRMIELKEQMKRARETGDTTTMARLEKEGPAWQSRLHQQGFGGAPVDDLLVDIADELPSIQKAAGVTNLVSKWNQAELDRHPRAERFDVTMQLVDAFHPNETQRRRAIEIQKTKPQKIKD